MRGRRSPVFERFSAFDFSVCFDSAGSNPLFSLDMTPELTGSGHFDFGPASAALISAPCRHYPR
jgi:hypothetical protein